MPLIRLLLQPVATAPEEPVIVNNAFRMEDEENSTYSSDNFEHYRTGPFSSRVAVQQAHRTRQASFAALHTPYVPITAAAAPAATTFTYDGHSMLTMLPLITSLRP